MREASLLRRFLVLRSPRTAIASILIAVAWPAGAQAPTDSTSAATTATAYRQPPVFVENRGQWAGDFLYRTRVGAMTVFIERNGWTFTLVERKEKAKAPDDPLRDPGRREYEVRSGVAVSMRFVGSSGAAKIIPGARRPGVHHYFLGSDPSKWKTDVPLYDGVRLAGVWPGVDLGTRTEAGHFEYDVFASPGADLAQVVIEVAGGRGLRLDSDGALVIATALGPVRQPLPKTWQVMPDGRRESIECNYVLLGERRYGFTAPERDPQRPLVVDPGLLYSTFLGGSSGESAYSVAVDATGAATVAGTTYVDQFQTPPFPTTPGAYDTTWNGTFGNFDVFVTRLAPAGNALLYSTYIGGGTDDRAFSVALDATGAATVAGETQSTNFPATPGAYDTTSNGGYDAFVARLAPAGNALVYATYLGGGNWDSANSVALDATGAATVAGFTESNNFPATSGAYDTTFNGSTDAFVTQVAPAGNTLLYATYLGGGLSEQAYSVALDATGAATVVGYTMSNTGFPPPPFPVTPGAYDTTYNGGFSDAFVARLAPGGNALVYSTYLGGSGGDRAQAVALDATGAATVTGYTYTNLTGPTFPTTPGAYDTTLNGIDDVFVVRLAPNGNALLYSTFFGGAWYDYPQSVALDATGAATVTGYTDSANLPTTPGAYDTTFNGGSEDAFLARFAPSGNALLYATYLGGAHDDYAQSVALDATGAATVVGWTLSTGFPTTAGAYDTTLTGGSDAFVARFQLASFAHPLMAFPAVQSVQAGGILGIQVAGPAGAPVALMFDPVATSIPVPPYGTIGLNVPPLVTVDGIGLGFPGSIPGALNVGSQGILYFSYSPVPASMVGVTVYAQAVAVDVSLPPLPPFVGIGLSTHGNAALPTPACQVTFVP